jgi:hypothetical protein
MKPEEEFWFDIFCETPLRCFLSIFVGSYLLWWLVLDGPAKWDAYFEQEINTKGKPFFLKDPIKEKNIKTDNIKIEPIYVK